MTRARKPRTAMQLVYTRTSDAHRRMVAETAFREVSPRMAEIRRLLNQVSDLVIAELESRDEDHDFEMDL